MLFIDTLCPVCKTYELGSLSNSHRPKSKFKTCGSTICSTKLKAQNHKSGAKFTRLIKEYTGDDFCDYNCGSYARYEFSSGKKCCHSIASNCPSTRKTTNSSIAAKLKSTVEDNGLTATQNKANKTANTKRVDIDENGKNGYDRFSKKLKETIAASIDEHGRTYQSRSKVSKEEWLLKPEKEKYYQLVWEETDRQFYKHYYDIENSNLRSNNFHLDHIYSISEGFRHNIPYQVIGHFTNLRIISATENCSKQGKCHKTLTLLYEDYKLELALTCSND